MKKVKKKDIVNKIDIKKLSKIDGIFPFITDKYGDPPNWKREPGFVSLSKIILEQQVSLSSAKAHFNKLNEYLFEFTPNEILKLNDDEMRKCQISRQKGMYLRALAEAVVNESIIFDKFDCMESNDIRNKLMDIKGIGQWTVDIYLMFCLQEKDILPLGDIAIINAIKNLYNVNTKEEIILLSEKWKPFRSLAAFYFWHYYLKERNRPSNLDGL